MRENKSLSVGRGGRRCAMSADPASCAELKMAHDACFYPWCVSVRLRAPPLTASQVLQRVSARHCAAPAAVRGGLCCLPRVRGGQGGRAGRATPGRAARQRRAIVARPLARPAQQVIALKTPLLYFTHPPRPRPRRPPHRPRQPSCACAWRPAPACPCESPCACASAAAASCAWPQSGPFAAAAAVRWP